MEKKLGWGPFETGIRFAQRQQFLGIISNGKVLIARKLKTDYSNLLTFPISRLRDIVFLRSSHSVEKDVT